MVVILSAPDAFPRSGGLPVIVVQHPTQTLATPDRAIIPSVGFVRSDQPVAEALVVALAMIMRHELADRVPQRAFSE